MSRMGVMTVISGLFAFALAFVYCLFLLSSADTQEDEYINECVAELTACKARFGLFCVTVVSFRGCSASGPVRTRAMRSSSHAPGLRTRKRRRTKHPPRIRQ